MPLCHKMGHFLTCFYFSLGKDTCGQSYKQFTIVIYSSRGVLTVKLLILQL